MNGKISIIIPVYKVEDYLVKCIESVISQTYANLEIILVDDGSPDNCGRICDEYADKDDRIIVIHKENQGVARARNSALDIATGDYISFIDSDDWMAENAYEYLLKNLKNYKADCVVGRCQKVFDRNGELDYEDIKPEEIKCKTSTGAMRGVLKDGSAIWNRLFKRRVFDSIRFPVERINDDEVVALHAYAVCNRVVFLNETTYFYRIRENSITTSNFSLKKMDVFYNSKDNMEFVNTERPELYKYAEFKFAKAGLYCFVNLLKMKIKSEEEKEKKEEAIRYIRKEFKQKISSIKNNKSIPVSYRMVIRGIVLSERGRH